MTELSLENQFDANDSSSKVIVVDDERGSRLILRAYMAKLFDVVTCSSGEELVATLDSFKPDLILMDVDMPGLDGYETCRQVRQKGFTLPIIFVTAYQDLDVHLTAYDAGGDDLVTKPVDSEILLRKAKLAIHQKEEHERLKQEARSMHEMAMNFLSNAGENGVLLNFVRKAVEAKSYEKLAEELINAISEFGVESSVMLRHPEGQTILSSHGKPNQLEQSILTNMSGMGRIFKFQRQFIVNYHSVSLMFCNSPTDSLEKIGRIRDHAAILAETAEALCENVSMRIQSIARSEQMQIALITASESITSLRGNHHRLMLDTRILLQELIDNVEATYPWLSTSRGQEATISGKMNESVDKILEVLSNENKFDEEITKIHDALNVENNNNDNILF